MLVSGYDLAIQSIKSQIDIWSGYANDWKSMSLDTGFRENIDSITSRFSNNIFILAVNT